MSTPYEMMFGSRLLGDDGRQNYLTHVVMAFVATPEELAEFRDTHRAEFLQIWDKHVAVCNKYKLWAEEDRIRITNYHKNAAIKLRSLGLFDLAAKREEFIFASEKNKRAPDLKGVSRRMGR